jgi:hypothetical protein
LEREKLIAEEALALSCDLGGHPDNQKVLIAGYKHDALQSLARRGRI